MFEIESDHIIWVQHSDCPFCNDQLTSLPPERTEQIFFEYVGSQRQPDYVGLSRALSVEWETKVTVSEIKRHFRNHLIEVEFA